MKCTIIDKTPYDAYVELPNGMILSVPIQSVESKSIGDQISVNTENLYDSNLTNLKFNKLIDFF
ncbi:MAG: hypothetical protein ACRC2K_00440 [Clostridium sp.]